MIATYDNLDDRLQIHRMIGHLKPVWRWRFLDWLSSHTLTVAGGSGVAMHFNAEDYRRLVDAHHGVESANVYITNTTYWQALLMMEQYQIDPKTPLDVLGVLTKHRREDLEHLKRVTLANYAKHRIQLTPPGAVRQYDPANDRGFWSTLE